MTLNLRETKKWTDHALQFPTLFGIFSVTDQSCVYTRCVQDFTTGI